MPAPSRPATGNTFFQLAELAGLDAGTGYSTAFGPVVEGERMQIGLMNKARGTGARPHSHPNEQWNYVIKGKLRVYIEGQEERIVGPGTLLYFSRQQDPRHGGAAGRGRGVLRRQGPVARHRRQGGGRHHVRPALRRGFRPEERGLSFIEPADVHAHKRGTDR
ncbi:cupin domain-containing protein [Ancylobacter dichloromethanicus]